MKTYISGLIENLSDEVRIKFEKAEQYLKTLGYEPVNPLKIDEQNLEPWLDRMVILASCDAIFLLSDWIRSEESRIEKYYCEVTGKKVLFQSRVESDQYSGARIESLVKKIEGAIEEVTGLKLKDYADGPRTVPKYFCRMLFSVHCKKNEIEPEDIAFVYIMRDRTTILHYLDKYDSEVEFNPAFRSSAERVNLLLCPDANYGNAPKKK